MSENKPNYSTNWKKIRIIIDIIVLSLLFVIQRKYNLSIGMSTTIFVIFVLLMIIIEKFFLREKKDEGYKIKEIMNESKINNKYEYTKKFALYGFIIFLIISLIASLNGCNDLANKRELVCGTYIILQILTAPFYAPIIFIFGIFALILASIINVISGDKFQDFFWNNLYGSSNQLAMNYGFIIAGPIIGLIIGFIYDKIRARRLKNVK